MKRLVFPCLLALAVLAGCAAGQPFGPTLRSQCQEEELKAEPVLRDLVAEAKDAEALRVNPDAATSQQAEAAARKDALKECGRKMRSAQDACEANPSVANAKALGARTAECRRLADE